jgi:hypothetical protein
LDDCGVAKGITFGRPKVKVTEDFKIAYDGLKSGKTAVKAMNDIGVKKTTFYKLVTEYEKTL